MTRLVENWDEVKGSASQLVSDAIDPGVEAVRTVLEASDGQCPEVCLDLLQPAFVEPT